MTPSRAFFTIGEVVLISGSSPLRPPRTSRTCIAHDAAGLGGPPTTSTKHILQLPAIVSRS